MESSQTVRWVSAVKPSKSLKAFLLHQATPPPQLPVPNDRGPTTQEADLRRDGDGPPPWEARCAGCAGEGVGLGAVTAVTPLKLLRGA